MSGVFFLLLPFTFLFFFMSDDVFAEIDAEAGQQQEGTSESGQGSYSQELVSKIIQGRQRKFFIDLKESSNGKFVKMSELSRGGQRSTIMFDGEDVDAFIEALQEIKAAL